MREGSEKMRRETFSGGRRWQSGIGQQSQSSGSSQANNAGSTGIGSGQISPQTHGPSNREGSPARSNEPGRSR